MLRTLIAFGLCLSPLRADDEFFEKKIRPVLVEHCYRCHSDQAKEPKGGLRVDSRAFLLKGGDNGPALKAGDAKSKLLEAIRYGNADLAMPPKAKLPATVIADFEAWVKDGAKWPGEEKKAEPAKPVFDLAKRRAEHWAWQPVQPQKPPRVNDAKWALDPVDRFILAKLEEKKIVPALEASKSAWLRRVSFALTGLPPTPEELLAFEADKSSQAFEKVADRLLASPAYGERWGRHWLDLVRYAESRGHEFDFDIVNPWHYRDYVIRAFNDDLPYNQFASEQIAGYGDDGVRTSGGGRTNESIIGTGFWRFGEEVQSPVDIRQDQADRFDNRIDVFSKTFLGMTVACARCHDHKFDAISTKDYYALFGLLQGSSDTPIRIDGDGVNREIAGLRFHATSHPAQWPEGYSAALTRWEESVRIVENFGRLEICNGPLPNDSATFDFALHHRYAGDFSVRTIDGKPSLHREERTSITLDRYWSKLAGSRESMKEPGKLGGWTRSAHTLRSQLFTLESDNLYYLVRGSGMAYAAVGSHGIINGPLHGSLVEVFKNEADYRWVKHSLKDYRGQRFRVELTADPNTDFSVVMIVQGNTKPTMPPLISVPEASKEQRERVQAALAAIEAAPVWVSRIVTGVSMGNVFEGEPVFIRGNPRTPGERVTPGGLKALDNGASNYSLHGLAEQVTDPINPLFARVMVNRLWHHLFGRGIVASTDNFGVLGEKPTHPELLDYLAGEFAAGGYRMKPMLKRLVLSSTYRMSSSAENHPQDPANLLLHQFRLKRLESEALRDTMLLVSGRLDRTMYGPPVAMHLTPLMEGRGRPATSGPVDGAGRRSIYLAVRRNFLSPLLLAFDTPSPFSTVGTRQVSNVPAQALILMNDPFVHEQAKLWGTAIAKQPSSVNDKITYLYRQAFARPPTPPELKLCRDAVSDDASWTALAHSLINVKEFRYIP